MTSSTPLANASLTRGQGNLDSAATTAFDGTVDKDLFTALALYGAMGIQLAFSVVGCALLGYFLDQKWETTPALTVIGIVIGSAAGFIVFIKFLTWKNTKKF